MSVYDLSRDQLIELKQSLMTQRYDNVTFGELAFADELVPDSEIFARYSNTYFSPEDFLCSSKENARDGQEEQQNTLSSLDSRVARAMQRRQNDSQNGRGGRQKNPDTRGSTNPNNRDRG